VGSQIQDRRNVKLRSVYVLAPDSAAADIPPADLFIKGIRDALPGAAVYFGVLPTANRLAYVRRLLEGPAREGTLAGAVPISCGREIYQFLANAGIAAVVMGSLFSTGEPLASVDVDNRQEGHLLAEYLIGRGHSRIAAFNNSRDCPGDNYFHDGVSDALTEAGMAPNAAIMRFVPDTETMVAQFSQLMSLSDRPTGVMTPSLRLADAVAEAAEALGISLGEQLEIVFRDYSLAPVEQARYVHVQAQLPFDEYAGLVGRLLARLINDPNSDPEHVTLPVELRGPGVQGVVGAGQSEGVVSK
jgi:DNA-binding LacI/PurR family transcriptional regulator